jgi:catechol 2,3-dioxygenase-like lactoylglutathione lyase family enzyme
MPQQPPVSHALSLALILILPGIGALAQDVNPNPLRLAPHHATASVANIDLESAWYERVLGFQELNRFHQPDMELRNLGIPGYRIDLISQRNSARTASATGPAMQGWLHVVFSTDAIEADYKRLLALGVEVKVDRTAQSAISRLVFHDPEGNELEIVPSAPLPAH